MRVLYKAMVLSTLAVAAACGQKGDRNALRNSDDLLLPSTTPNAVVSPTELGLKDSVPAAPAPQAAPARARERVATRRVPRSTHRSNEYSRGSYGSRDSYERAAGYNPTPAPAQAPAPAPAKHTKRDAIVGAAAGAAIGAVMDGRHRVRGAVVGGVLGGILGGVVGKRQDEGHKF